MEKHILSKSTFIRGVQCLKSLYLYKNRYFLRDKLSPEQLAKFKRGTDVGIFAQNLFPGGIDCKPKSPSQYRMSVEKTAAILAVNTSGVIYEATFQYNRVLIMLDILVNENGKWNAYEVKSSLRLSETYLMDTALQYYVLTNAGVEINKFFLVHLNPDYAFCGKLNIAELFNFVDVTDEAKNRQSYVGQQIEDEKQAVALKKSPPIPIGEHCTNPYPCDFIGHCWKHIPKKSVFDPTQFFDKENFNRIFQTLKPPVFFVAFLSYRKAIPEWENFKPYDIVPVSCTVKKPGADASRHFVNTHPDKESDGEFFEFLKTEIGSECSLITYDGERVLEFLTRMAERNPVIKNQLEAISGHVFDLKNLNKESVTFHPKIESGNPLLSLQQLFAKAGSGASPFNSDTLAINEYLQFASKKSKMKAALETFYEYTNILADLTSEFYNYLNQKNLS